MARFLIHNQHKTKVLGQPNPKDPSDYKKFTPLYFGDTSVFLKPGEKTEVAGCDATVNLIIGHIQQHATVHEFGESLVIKELPDAAQTVDGEPIWVVVIKEDAINPHTGKQVEFPLAAHSCGRTWNLQSGPNEMTQFCAEGVQLACGWAVEAVMSRADWQKTQEETEEETQEETEEETQEETQEETEEIHTIADWGKRFRRKGISDNEVKGMEEYVKSAHWYEKYAKGVHPFHVQPSYTRKEFLYLWDEFCKHGGED